MQDRADQQRVARLLPVIAAFECAFRIDQDIGDVLNVTDLVRAFPHFEQWVVTRGTRIGRVEEEAVEKSDSASRPSAASSRLDVGMTAEPVQESSVGTTRPMPLPERVGAKAITCSGPSWRR